MGIKVKITPTFNVKKIIDETIMKDWFNFQLDAMEMGKIIWFYMQSYIHTHHSRNGNTGNLADAIKLYKESGTATVSWGIGKLSVIQKEAPYWYVINFGRMITGQPYIPFHGATIGASFEGNPPDPNMRGTGVGKQNVSKSGDYFWSAKSHVQAMNYIEATYFELDRHLALLFMRTKKG